MYIDGLNLFYGALKGTPFKWLDVEAFARRLLPRDYIAEIRYFTAVVNSRPNDPRTAIRHQTYLRAIETSPSVTVHRGRFTRRVRTRVLADEFMSYHDLFTPRFRPRVIFSLLWKDKVRRRTSATTSVRVIIEEEKGSDVNIAAFLVDDAARQAMNKAIVVSNDSDLVNAITLARGFGVQVGVLNPHLAPTSKQLRDAASFELRFRRSIVATCQLPNIVVDDRGREIHKPREWR